MKIFSWIADVTHRKYEITQQLYGREITGVPKALGTPRHRRIYEYVANINGILLIGWNMLIKPLRTLWSWIVNEEPPSMTLPYMSILVDI